MIAVRHAANARRVTAITVHRRMIDESETEKKSGQPEQFRLAGLFSAPINWIVRVGRAGEKYCLLAMARSGKWHDKVG